MAICALLLPRAAANPDGDAWLQVAGSRSSFLQHHPHQPRRLDGANQPVRPRSTPRLCDCVIQASTLTLTGRLRRWLASARNSRGFYGTVPTEIGLLTNLGYLYTPSALLSIRSGCRVVQQQDELKSFPPPSSAPALTRVLVSCRLIQQNGFTGTIPTEIGNLSWIRFIYVGGNELSGAIPTVLGSLPNLESLCVPPFLPPPTHTFSWRDLACPH